MNFFSVSILIVLLFNIICTINFLYKNAKYQKMWYEEKAMRKRVNPMITRAELCEQYVMFCKRNDCKVEF